MILKTISKQWDGQWKAQTGLERKAVGLNPLLIIFLPVLLNSATKSAANMSFWIALDSAPLLLQDGKTATEEKNNFDWQSSSASKNSTVKVANNYRDPKQEKTDNSHDSPWFKSIYTVVSFQNDLISDRFIVYGQLTAPHYFTVTYCSSLRDTFFPNPKMMSSSPTDFSSFCNHYCIKG